MENQTNLTNVIQDSQVTRMANHTHVVLYSILLVWSLLGNVLVIAVVFGNKNLRTNFNYLIVNMAVSDLFIPLIILPLKITQEANGQEWLVDGPLGNVLCKLCYFLADISPAVSVLTLVIIAVNRYMSIAYPLKSQTFSRKKCRILISLTWIPSMVLFSPYFYTFRLKYFVESSKSMCLYTWSPAFDDKLANAVFASVLISLVFVIPLLTIIVLYSLILYKLNLNTKNIAGMLNDKQAQTHRNRNNNIFYVSVVIITSFIFLWGPFYCILAVSFIGNFTFSKDAFFMTLFAVQFLGYSNSALNPCIYFIFLKHFRQGLKRLYSKTSKSNSSQASRICTALDPKDASKRLIQMRQSSL